MWKIKILAEINSTQDEAVKYINNPNNHNSCVFYSPNQKKGYGTRGRSWVSADESFAASFAIPTEKSYMFKNNNLSIPVGILVLEVLENALKKPEFFYSLKWPNDLLINGKKFGGILINQFDRKNFSWIIIGIGLNVKLKKNYKKFIAGSLLEKKESSTKFNHMSIIDQFIKCFSKLINIKSFDNFREEFNKRDFYKNKMLKVQLSNKNEHIGKNKGIDKQGKLILELSNKEEILIHSGTLRLM